MPDGDMNPEVTMEDLRSIFDLFNAAILKGDIDEAMKYRTEEVKIAIQDAIKTPQEKADTLQMFQAMLPVSSTLDHLDLLDKKATLYTTSTFHDPENPDEMIRQALMIHFLKESGVWKMGDMTYLAGPDSIKHSEDQSFEPESSYDLDKNTSMGGRIVSVQFESNYTLVVVRMIDEDDLVFLPKKEDLEKSGLKTELLVPWKIIQVEGHPHKSNIFKILGSKAEIIEVE